MAQTISILYGSQNFPDTSASVRVSIVDMSATSKGERMMLRNISRSMGEPEAEEGTTLGREAVIVAAKDGHQRNGVWTYKSGSIENNIIVNISVRSVRHGGMQNEDSLLILSDAAPVIQVMTNFPHEQLAVTNTYQIFKGKGWPLPISALKDMNLKPKPAYALAYLELIEATSENIMFLDFDEDKYTYDDMMPNVEISTPSKGGKTQIIPVAPATRRQVRVRRNRRD